VPAHAPKTKPAFFWAGLASAIKFFEWVDSACVFVFLSSFINLPFLPSPHLLVCDVNRVFEVLNRKNLNGAGYPFVNDVLGADVFGITIMIVRVIEIIGIDNQSFNRIKFAHILGAPFGPTPL
jgi:hypothetical protein